MRTPPADAPAARQFPEIPEGFATLL